jgi:hypothetical protein
MLFLLRQKVKKFQENRKSDSKYFPHKSILRSKEWQIFTLSAK